jgi:hypothetical protein
MKDTAIPFRSDKDDDQDRTRHLDTLEKIDDLAPVFSIREDASIV